MMLEIIIAILVAFVFLLLWRLSIYALGSILVFIFEHKTIAFICGILFLIWLWYLFD